ncbi:MAG: DNA invertase Pin-like site-specific DNA recombinase [Oleiphilaceae bacterium]|jgi:DNA invertase Pin-like site-specific DNA recombinase
MLFNQQRLTLKNTPSKMIIFKQLANTFRRTLSSKSPQICYYLHYYRLIGDTMKQNTPHKALNHDEPMIYSYRRVSTSKQLAGTGKQQQKESMKLEELSNKYALPIYDEVFEDDGKSAFHGKHLEANLGIFLNAVATGDIAKGSILALFSLDRLSRLEIMKANNLFSGLLSNGIRVYTATDDKLYGGDSGSHFLDLIMSLVYLERAHDESRHKSDRTVGHALTKIKEHKENKRSPDGYAYAIQSVGGQHPWWIQVDSETNEVKEHPVYFKVAMDVITKRLNGWGTNRIIDHLNSNVAPPPARNHKANGTGWGYNMISRIHHTTSPMGTRKFKLRDTEYVLKNYFPPLLSEMELYRLQARLKVGSPKASANRISLLTGIGVAKCKLCGNTVGAKFNKNEVVVYYCVGRGKRIADENGKVCKGWSVTGFELDVKIMLLCRTDILKKVDDNPKEGQAELLFIRIAELDKKIEGFIAVIDLMDDPSLVPELALKMNELTAARKKLHGERKAVQNTLQTNTTDQDIKWAELTKDVLDPYAYDPRAKMRNFIQQTIERIEIKPLMGSGKSRKLIAIVRFRNSDHVRHIHFKPFFTRNRKSLREHTDEQIASTEVK